MRSRLFVTTFCLLGFACILVPAGVLSQPLRGLPEEIRVFVDSRGDTIPSNPANVPFKMINGFPEYRVGPGDILEITTVEAGERKTETSRILPDGTVSFSVVNNVPIGDMALSEVVKTLTRALSRYVRNPQMQVTVKEYFSKRVSVFGSINASLTSLTGARTGPGVYPLKGRITALDQILESGGPTSDARLDRVRFIRANRTYFLDLQKAISAGDNRQNIVLEHGDVIQVPGIAQADRRVAVLGEVSAPGVFNLSIEANMLEAIAASRGFTEDASANRIRVIRMEDPINPEILTVNAERILRGDLSQNIGLEDGDIIVVPRDYLADLNDLLAQLSPILNWGGLVATSPVVSIGGFDVNSPTAGRTIIEAEAIPSVPLTPATTIARQQAVVEQVQRNLRGPLPAEEKK